MSFLVLPVIKQESQAFIMTPLVLFCSLWLLWELVLYSDLMDDMDDLDGYSIEPNFFLDVPFVPTDDALIAAMIRLAEVTKDDLVYDLGAGDGRIVISVARQLGARAVGVELDPLRIAEAMEDAAMERVEHLVDFVEGDLFTADFSKADVVMLYLMDSVNAKLRPRLLKELKPGARIVSHAFDMGDWEADEQVPLSGITLYKWVVPARVEGEWEWEGPDGKTYYIDLQQKYQQITGQAWIDDTPAQVSELKIFGPYLQFTIQAEHVEPRHLRFDFSDHELEPAIEWS